jgi:hypothetical protein
MRSTLVIAGLGVLASLVLVLLNPGLLVNAGIGICLGLGVRWVSLVLRRDTTLERPETTRDETRGMRRSNRVVLLVGIFLAGLSFVGVITFVGGGQPSAQVRSTLHTPYTMKATYSSSRQVWTITERFTFTDEALAEVSRLLNEERKPIPSGAPPEAVASDLAAALSGGLWTAALDTGKPVLLRTSEVNMPDEAPWRADAELAVTWLSGDTFAISPADESMAVLEAPRHLILQAVPAIKSDEYLPGDAAETLSLTLDQDTNSVRLDVAPWWARSDFTAPAMTFSLGQVARTGITAVSGAISAAFGAAVLARIRSIWQKRKPRPRRPAPPSKAGRGPRPVRHARAQ